MATQFSQWLPQNFNQGQFNPNAQDAAAALGPQPQPQQQPQTQTPPPKNPWWNPFGFQRYGSAAEASGGAPPGQMTQPPQPTMPPTTEHAPLLPDFGVLGALSGLESLNKFYGNVGAGGTSSGLENVSKLATGVPLGYEDVSQLSTGVGVGTEGLGGTNIGAGGVPVGTEGLGRLPEDYFGAGTDVPPPAPLASSPPSPLPTGSPFPQPPPTPFDQSIASGQPQPQPQQPQLQFQPSLTQPGQGLIPQGGQGLAQQMQQVLGPERFTPTPPYIQPTPMQGPQVNQQPPPQPVTTADQPPPVPVGQTLSPPPSFGQPQPPPPGGQQQPGQTFFSPANALAGDQPLPPAGQGTPLDITPAGLQEGMGNIRTATNMPRQKAIAAAQAAIARGERKQEAQRDWNANVPDSWNGYDGKTEEQIIPEVDLAKKATGPPGGDPQEEMSIRRAPEEDFTAVPVETTLSAEEEAPVEVLEQPAGAYAAISSFLDNPQVQMAMLQAAKALDPKGFGGTLAVGMEPVLKGKDYQSYVSDLLSGKPPEEITSGTILSPKEKATAIKQYQGQQLVDKAESPLQKLYRDIAKTATSGEYSMAVAKMKIAAEMAKSINASTSAKDKKEVTEAYKALSDVRGKLSVDIMSADGTINEASLTQAMLGGQQLMTPGDKEALMAAVKYLEDSGYETLGMRSLLDATDNLTQPVTTNPLAPPPPASAVKGPESVEAGVASGALTDHGDGTYTVNVPGHPFNGQKVEVKDGELRTL